MFETKMPSTVDDLYTKLQSLASKEPTMSVDDKTLEKISRQLERFLGSNDKTFNFTSDSAKSLTELLIQNLKWIVPGKDQSISRSILHTTFNHLQVLRILSRDPQVVQMIGKENYQFLLVFTSFSDRVANGGNLAEPSMNIYQDIDAEALKLFCNFSYHNSGVRKYLINQKYSKTLLSLVKKRVESRLFLESDVFLMRLLFLLSALEIQERQAIRRDYHGVSIMSDALTTLVENLESGSLDGAVQDAGKTAAIPPAETKLACEILKALFNITVGISDAKVVDFSIVGECSQLLKQLFHLFTHYKLDYLESDNVFTHSANLLLNMPKDSFETFIPFVEVCKEEEEHSADSGNKGNDLKEGFIEFHGYNMSAIDCLLQGLGARLKSELNMAKPELLPSLLSCLSYMCRLCKPIRKFVRFRVLPPLKDARKRPEESNDMRGRLVQLMTDIDRNIKYLAADFLFVLCKENVDRLVKHTGYGNAAGFLASRGLMLGRNNEFTGDYSSSDDDSDTEEYRGIEDKIDPITGAIRSENHENPLQGMTEEEKELEAEKLVNLIGQLSDMKVIQPMKVGEDGRPVELRESEIKDIMRKKLDDHKS